MCLSLPTSSGCVGMKCQNSHYRGDDHSVMLSSDGAMTNIDPRPSPALLLGMVGEC